MSYKIKKAAVLGAGVMGTAIAANLANAGIKCVLLNNIPSQLTDEDKKNGLTEENPKWRNRPAADGLARTLKSKPPSFYSGKTASLVEIGNLQDDLNRLSDVDWVIEAVVENLKIKQNLLAKVEKFVKPECIVSTNTSGLPIKDISADFGTGLKEHFLGVHFFNPPRYMKLVEVIPGEETKRELVYYITEFCEEALGKSVVICKDVNSFIANRIGTFDLSNATKIMLDKGLAIEELDALIGKEAGRPGSSIFGTLDLIGLDTMRRIMFSLYEASPDDEMRAIFVPQDLMNRMVKKKWLGNKTGQGFYKRMKDKKGKSVKLVLDYNKMEYIPLKKTAFNSISEAKKMKVGPEARLKALFNGTDIAADVVREYLCRNFIYAANRIPEICDSIVEIDNAMRWGFNHELGPFEEWDAVGLRESLEVMDNLKLDVPGKITGMVEADFESFYLKKGDDRYYYDFKTKGYVKLKVNSKIILLSPLKERGKVVMENPCASLVDIGDGVTCLEFHTKMNTIDDSVIQMIFDSCDIVEKDFLGMVVANHGTNFSVGVNLFMVLDLIGRGEWATIDRMIQAFQNANMRMKFLEKPVVTAPAGMALGGGCEMSMHGARCQPCGETYIGLVEVMAGVIPAGGGTKELMVRCTEGIPAGSSEAASTLPAAYNKVFDNIFTAKVSTSASEAMEMGYIRETDTVSINRGYQIRDAKEVALRLSKSYKKPEPSMIFVMGEQFSSACRAALDNMRQGNFISDYDVHVAMKLAGVISGGDFGEGTPVTEQKILDLEREAFMSLCGEAKTQDRIKHVLKTGKPLRN
jgi:3-hydroxyacyl-CoA dehydrogenase